MFNLKIIFFFNSFSAWHSFSSSVPGCQSVKARSSWNSNFKRLASFEEDDLRERGVASPSTQLLHHHTSLLCFSITTVISETMGP